MELDMRALVRENPVLAILRNVPLRDTAAYAGAVVEGGVRFEVALNSPHALEQISLLRRTFGDKALVGAGTAVTPEKARAALDAGAQFLLTPSAPLSVLEFCRQNRVTLLPGVLTPTDVQACLDHGFSTLKLFPAGDMPMGYVKSLQGPYDDTEYVAIGGVTAGNAAEFIRAGCLGVGLAGALTPKAARAAGDWAACTEAVAALAQAVAAARGA